MKLPTGGHIVIGVLALVALVLGICFLLAWRDALPAIEPPGAGDFAADTIARGAQLAALGGCAPCHTAPGGASFAGGRAIDTPFGRIFSTNITPDPHSGIGRWSEAAFRRAMREGVDREGRQLYPAFPYDHFTLVSDTDDAALYAYLMTRRPVRAEARQNQLGFPLRIRWILAAWKLRYFHPGPYQPDTAHDELWNRGAYLVNGLAHCGACHTPRNRFGAENPAQRFAGTEAEDWYAYAINSASQARVPWDADSLSLFLRNGWHDRHGIAQGPMARVTDDLARVPDSDCRAIAVYVAWLMSESTAAGAPKAAPPNSRDGQAIYAAACADCHDGARPLPIGGVRLELSTAVSGESAINLINVVLDGVRPPEGAAGPIMPGFASTLSDTQLDSLVTYLRGHFAGKPPWPAFIEHVREARRRSHD
ncbi:MAG TPA: cytochrome c [Steroidobacteraceae bacterium]|nr:cytochrome c [Steroidobacteraceae bacterium]